MFQVKRRIESNSLLFESQTKVNYMKSSASIIWYSILALTVAFHLARFNRAFASSNDHKSATSKQVLSKLFQNGILGIEFVNNAHHRPIISTIYPDTPAAKAPLQKGDIVLKVEEKETTSLTKEQVYHLLTGKPKTTVRLTLLRGNLIFKKTLQRMDVVDLDKKHPELAELYVDPF